METISIFLPKVVSGFGTASTSETPEDGAKVEGSGSLFGAGVGPGLAVFVGEQIALEGLLRYYHVSTSTEFNDDRDWIAV